MRTTRLLLACILIFSGLALYTGCGEQKDKDVDSSTAPADENGQPASTTETGDLSLATSDGYTIAGTFVKGSGNEPLPACLLVHMLNHDRSTYAEFQDHLAYMGISSLAIDLRGHGDSTADGTLDFKKFNDSEWVAVINDLKAGLGHLRSRPDVNPNLIGIVGASISANMALILAADEFTEDVEKPLKALVLLSPGMSYHGYEPIPRARDIFRMPVYVAAAVDDAMSFRGAQTISQAARGGELHEFEGSDHGTALFDAHPELMDEIAQWLNARVTGYAERVDDSPTDIAEPASTEGGES